MERKEEKTSTVEHEVSLIDKILGYFFIIAFLAVAFNGIIEETKHDKKSSKSKTHKSKGH